MPITNYSELQTEVADWLKRDDLTEKIKNFIALGEARINSEPELNLRAQEVRVTADMVADQQYYGLPNKFKSMRFVNVISLNPQIELGYMPPERFHDFKRHVDGTKDEPEKFTIIGDELKIGPIPNAAYTMEMIYYKRWDALSDSNTTTWLLTNQPDIYLFGALLAAEPYLRKDDRIQVWADFYREAVDRVIAQDKADRYPTGADSNEMEFQDILISNRDYWWFHRR